MQVRAQAAPCDQRRKSRTRPPVVGPPSIQVLSLANTTTLKNTLYINNVDIAPSRAFTESLARKPLPAAMRIPLGINGFPFCPRIIGSRPLHDADARRNRDTCVCPPLPKDHNHVKKSDHQRRNTLSENLIHVGTGSWQKERPHVVEALSTLGPHFVTRDSFPERISRCGIKR